MVIPPAHRLAKEWPPSALELAFDYQFEWAKEMELAHTWDILRYVLMTVQCKVHAIVVWDIVMAFVSATK